MKARTISITLTEEAFDNLMETQRKSGLELQGVFKKSLALYEMLLDGPNDGYEMIIREKDGKEELIQP